VIRTSFAALQAIWAGRTADTVATDTPAWAATSRIVAAERP